MENETTFKFLIDNSDISYKEIVEATGVTKQMVSYWAKGARPISDKHIKIICDLLHIPESYLSVGLDIKGRLRFKKEQLLKDCAKYGFSLEEL